MPRRVAIVGATARAAAFSALRAGLVPVAADLFRDADLVRVAEATRVDSYPDGFEPWLARQNCDAWFYTGGLENHPALVERMARSRTLWGVRPPTLEAIRDPYRLQDWCRAEGIRFPATRPALATGDPGRAWLAKPIGRSGGLGIRELSPGERTVPAPGSLFQEKVEGETGSALFVGRDHEAELLGITRQLTRRDFGPRGGFEYAGSVGPWKLQRSIFQAVGRIGQRLCQAYRIRGLFGIDFVVCETEVVLLEVNPRYTASVEVLERACGFAAVGLHAAAFSRERRLETKRVAPGVGLTHGKAILFAGGVFRFRRSHLSLLEPTPGDAAVGCSIADIPQDGTVIEAGKPVLTLFSVGRGVSEVVERLASRLAEVERAIYVEDAASHTRGPEREQQKGTHG